jgi:hypothetical protein
MVQIIGFLMIIAVAILAIKVALIMVFFIGIIFRPKETIGLILVLGVLALLRNYPVPSLLVGIIGTAGIIYMNRKAAASKEVAEDAQITDQTEN